MLRRAAQRLGGQLQHQPGGAAGLGWSTASRTGVLALSSREADLRGGGGGGHHRYSTALNLSGSRGAHNKPTDFVAMKDTWVERRRVWRQEMDALRKVWAVEYAERMAVKAARVAEQNRILQLEKAERKRVRAIRQAKTVIREKAKKVEEIKKWEEFAVAAARGRRQKAYVTKLRSTAREEELLNASCGWVKREDLDVQIEYAIKHPIRMY